VFNSEIVGDNTIFDWGKVDVIGFLICGDTWNGPEAGFTLPKIGLLGGNFFDEITAFHWRSLIGGLDGFILREFRGDDCSHRASIAQVLRECSGVDVFNSDDFVLCKIVG